MVLYLPLQAPCIHTQADSLLYADSRLVMSYEAPKPAKEDRKAKRERATAAAKIKAGAILTGSVVETNPNFAVVELPEGD